MRRGGRRAVLGWAALVASLGAVGWFLRPRFADLTFGPSDPLAAVLGSAALVVSVWGLLQAAGRRPRREDGGPSVGPTPSGLDAAVEYLAEETLRYWQQQAVARRITTPSPVSVRWRWADDDVAVPADELAVPVVLTRGVVTRLREQLYGRDVARVVLLGGPGAGKTAAMLLLLIDVLKHRRTGAPDGSPEPVPVWITMGGWNPATPLLDWVAARLSRDYPALAAEAYGGPGTAAELVRTGRVAPFLDGLDELPPALQGLALQAIDRETVDLRLTLTSRPGEWAAALRQGRLWGAAVVELLPVEVEQAAAFLLAEQLGDRRRTWEEVVRQLRDCPDGVAARTLVTPLALSLARETYADADPADLLDRHAHPTPDLLLRHLLSRSLALAYPDARERDRALAWLAWIARQLGTDRDLRWWDIPGWALAGRPRRLAALVGGPSRTPQILQLRRPSWRQMLAALAQALSTMKRIMRAFIIMGIAGVGLGFGVYGWSVPGDDGGLYGLAMGVLFGSFFGFVGGGGVGALGGFVVGFVGGILAIGRRPLATARAVGPLEVYRSDLRHTWVSGLVGALAGGLLGGLLGALLAAQDPRSGAGAAFAFAAAGLSFGLLGGLWSGIGPGVQLAAVELIGVARCPRAHVVRLLETALDRQVLRQAGAVYQFRHAALQDLLRG